MERRARFYLFRRRGEHIIRYLCKESPTRHEKTTATGALLCTACLAAQARNRYFTHLTLDDGLSHNHIKAIVQDSYGFIWIGTKNGLNRYDGSSIRIFQCFDPATGHGDSNISSLYEDTERRLWCGTDRGIYIYTPLTERFEEFTHTTEEGTAITNWVAAIESDPSGAVWAVVPNQGLFCWRNGQLRTYPVPGPQCLCIRRNGQVWGRHLRRRTLPLQCRGGSFRRLPHRPATAARSAANTSSPCASTAHRWPSPFTTDNSSGST